MSIEGLFQDERITVRKAGLPVSDGSERICGNRVGHRRKTRPGLVKPPGVREDPVHVPRQHRQEI